MDLVSPVYLMEEALVLELLLSLHTKIYLQLSREISNLKEQI